MKHGEVILARAAPQSSLSVIFDRGGTLLGRLFLSPGRQMPNHELHRA